MNFGLFDEEEKDITEISNELGALKDILISRDEPEFRTKALANILKKFSSLPYENITKHIAQQKLIPPSDVLRGYKTWGTGATCFPLVYLLKRMLDVAKINSQVFLADRTYAPASHTFVIAEIDGRFYIVDVGFLIYIPVDITSGSTTVELPQGKILFDVSGDKIEVYTVFPNGHRKFRYKAKLSPVGRDEFADAWNKTYEFEMMNHVVVSKSLGDKIVYIRNNFVHFVKDGVSKNIKMEKQEVLEIVAKLGIERNIFSRVWDDLLNPSR